MEIGGKKLEIRNLKYEMNTKAEDGMCSNFRHS